MIKKQPKNKIVLVGILKDRFLCPILMACARSDLKEVFFPKKM